MFQIEEPDGSPADPDVPGAAVGIDVTGTEVEVAIAVGGNAVVLADRQGFKLDLSVRSASSTAPDWKNLLEGAKLRAERALARPVTHAVVVADETLTEPLHSGAAELELVLLRFLRPAQIPDGQARVLAAAILAEDLAPRIAAPE